MDVTATPWQPSQFFNPWEPLPGFSSPPADGALAERIRKTVEFAVRNGPQFIQVLQTRQKDNPEYSFLFGGAGGSYYSWALYCLAYQHPIDEPPPHGQTTAPIPAASTAQYVSNAGTSQSGLPAEVEQGFAQVLATLTGSKDSIKTSQSWFMACAVYASGMAFMMAKRVVELAEYEKQLHLIYLANDILFKSLAQRPAGADPLSDHIAQGFKPVLGIMLAAAYRRGGQTEEVKARLGKILSFWAERSILESGAITVLEQQMLNADPAALLASTRVQPPAYPVGYAASQPPGLVAAAPAAAPPAFATPSYSAQQQAPAAMLPGSSQYPGSSVPWLGSTPSMPSAWAGPPALQQYSMAPGLSPQAVIPPGAVGPPGGWPTGPGYHSMPAAPPGYGGTAAMQGGYPPAASQYAPPPGPMAHGLPFGAHAVPPPAAPFPPTPPQQPRPVNSFSFPPGLLPKLVREKNRDDDPYSPLLQSDIERAGLPPPPEKDAYMRSRLERFYAEIAEYRPGMCRADVEEQRDRDRRERGVPADAEEEHGSRRRRTKGFEPAAADPETGMMPDGSFGGGAGLGSESQYAGLGSHSKPTRTPGDDDMYEQYRRARSGVYHEVLAKTITVPPTNFSQSARAVR